MIGEPEMTEQPKLQLELTTNYLALPVTGLLEEYGSGRHVPGSGSASALSSLIALEMMRTVCKLTIRKPQYQSVRSQFEYVQKRLDSRYKPKLIDLFEADIRSFAIVAEYRMLRDQAGTSKEKTRFNQLSLREQKKATKIPIEICSTSLDMLPFAFLIYDNGFKSARGDSGVAISNFLFAISAGLFVTFPNLKSFRPSQWRHKMKATAENLARNLHKYQQQGLLKVLQLYEEALPEDDNQLRLEFGMSPD